MCAFVTYSLGVILYELLNGTTPIERGESAAAQMSSRLTVGSSCMVVRNLSRSHCSVTFSDSSTGGTFRELRTTCRVS